jgi:hypothetical protein
MNNLIKTVEISLIEGDEVEDLVYRIIPMGVDISNLYIKEIEIVRHNGYGITSQVEISQEKVLDMVNIRTLKIRDIHFRGNRFEIESEVFLLGRVYKAQFDTKRILIPVDLSKSEFILLESQKDLEDYPIDISEEYLGLLVYVDESISDEELGIFYKKMGDNPMWELLYEELLKFEMEEFNGESIEEYIKMVVNSASDEGVIDLSQFVLLYFYN